MNSKLIKILIISCLLLIVILLVEWGYSEYSKKQLLGSLDKISEQSYQENKLPEINLSDVPVDHYSEMIDRPLFIKDRKPIVEDNTINTNVLDSGKIDDWILVGIYSDAVQLNALFKGQNKQEKHQKKRQGDEISGWVLKEILTDRVIIERSGEKQSIMLRKPKPKLKSKSKLMVKPKINFKPKNIKLKKKIDP